VANDYFDNSVKALFDANPLKETMIQKYLAFFGASGESLEAYNDYRRLKAMGESFIELSNPNNNLNSHCVTRMVVLMYCLIKMSKRHLVTANTYILKTYGGLADLANLTYI
jgi:hypothetical protein